jgi:hypothetical protein
MSSAAFEKDIANKVPVNALAHCVALFDENPFQFKITRNRKSKSGDYRYDKRSNTSIVTVNSGLNTYSFLITLVHEIAHHTTRINNGRSVQPHGREWKNEFRNLMLPLVNPLVFPDDLLRLLAKHLKNPKASTWSDAHLSMALRKYNTGNSKLDELHLDEIINGNDFKFNDRVFTKLEKRRTRVLCQESTTGRKYLIPKQAVVKLI